MARKSSKIEYTDQYPFLPPRIEWRPPAIDVSVEIPELLPLTFREAAGGDMEQIGRLIKDYYGWYPKYGHLKLWMVSIGHVVTLVVRNQRNAVALCVSRHSPISGNEVLYLIVPENYRNRGLEQKLLLGAALELPEMPTTVRVKSDDTDQYRLLRRAGWEPYGVAHDDDKHRKLNHKPYFIGLGSPGVGEPPSQENSSTSGG